MAKKNRTTQIKREREQKKRERQRRKTEKAALKRERRFSQADGDAEALNEHPHPDVEDRGDQTAPGQEP